MNHMSISLLKSVIRIVACIILVLIELKIATCNFFNREISGLLVFTVLFGIAEVLGILEEIFDKRKEK